MTEPQDLFVRLTCEFEDLHALAVEGQSASNDHIHIAVLAHEICNGVQRCIKTVQRIKALSDRP